MSEHIDHVPPPWFVGERNPDPLFPDEVAIYATVEEGQPLGPRRIPTKRAGRYNVAAVLPAGDRPDSYPELADATAAFIVRAVNAHADLLKLCRDYRAVLAHVSQAQYREAPNVVAATREQLERVEAAIANATGGTP